MTLLVDVGTNAEIVLGNGERLLCSSPTGPAFEGAQISSVMSSSRCYRASSNRPRYFRAKIDDRL